MPNFKFIDWAGYRFDPAMLACVVNQIKTNETGYSLFLFAFAWLVPVFPVCYCYIYSHSYVCPKVTLSIRSAANRRTGETSG